MKNRSLSANFPQIVLLKSTGPDYGVFFFFASFRSIYFVYNISLCSIFYSCGEVVLLPDFCDLSKIGIEDVTESISDRLLFVIQVFDTLVLGK